MFSFLALVLSMSCSVRRFSAVFLHNTLALRLCFFFLALWIYVRSEIAGRTGSKRCGTAFRVVGMVLIAALRNISGETFACLSRSFRTSFTVGEDEAHRNAAWLRLRPATISIVLRANRLEENMLAEDGAGLIRAAKCKTLRRAKPLKDVAAAGFCSEVWHKTKDFVSDCSEIAIS